MKERDKKMRIVQLGPVPPPYGGVATNMLAIHRALIERGHESMMIDITNRKASAASTEVLKPRSAIELLRMLAGLKCDVVHYHIGGGFGIKLALLTLLCGLLPGKRSVVTFHSGGYARDAADRAVPHSIRGAAFRSVDLLVGVNEQILRMFRSFGAREDRIRLILPFEQPSPDQSLTLEPAIEEFVEKSNPLLLSVGALEPEYGNEALIKAMPQVIDALPDAGLMIIGSGSRETELRDLTAVCPAAASIMLTGNLEHAIVLNLIQGADALLRMTEYDGDSIVVREALYLGTPVIASDNATRPEGVRLVNWPLNPQALTQVILQEGEAQFGGHCVDVTDGQNAEKVIEAYGELLAR